MHPISQFCNRKVVKMSSSERVKVKTTRRRFCTTSGCPHHTKWANVLSSRQEVYGSSLPSSNPTRTGWERLTHTPTRGSSTSGYLRKTWEVRKELSFSATALLKWSKKSADKWVHWKSMVSFGFFTIKKSDAFLSDYLTDRSKFTQNKIYFAKHCPQWSLNPQPPDHHSNALPSEARQESVGLEISEVSFVFFMHHLTCWTLFISRINRAWLYKGLNDSHRQPNSDLAQLAEH